MNEIALLEIRGTREHYHNRTPEEARRESFERAIQTADYLIENGEEAPPTNLAICLANYQAEGLRRFISAPKN